MRFTTASVILGLTSSALADFYVYYAYTQGLTGGTDGSWSLFSSPPDCNDLGDAPVFTDEDDVSSGRGIRCDGGCSGVSDDDIDELEMKWGDMHWTYYRNRGGNLVDTDDNTVGNCEMDRSHELSNCFVGVGKFDGWRVLSCETDEEPEGLGN